MVVRWAECWAVQTVAPKVGWRAAPTAVSLAAQKAGMLAAKTAAWSVETTAALSAVYSVVHWAVLKAAPMAD